MGNCWETEVLSPFIRLIYFIRHAKLRQALDTVTNTGKGSNMPPTSMAVVEIGSNYALEQNWIDALQEGLRGALRECDIPRPRTTTRLVRGRRRVINCSISMLLYAEQIEELHEENLKRRVIAIANGWLSARSQTVIPGGGTGIFLTIQKPTGP